MSIQENMPQNTDFLDIPLWFQAHPKNSKEKITQWQDPYGYIYRLNDDNPSNTDVLVLLYLLFNLKNKNWPQELEFSRYRILKDCKFRTNSHWYERIEKTLEKWASVNVTHKNILLDETEYRTLDFHIIDSWTQEKNSKRLKIHFSPYWLKHIKNSNFFQKTTFQEINVLRSSLALGLYSNILQNFQHSDVWEVDSKELFKKVPLKSHYPADIIPQVISTVNRIISKTSLKIRLEITRPKRGIAIFTFKKVENATIEELLLFNNQQHPSSAKKNEQKSPPQQEKNDSSPQMTQSPSHPENPSIKQTITQNNKTTPHIDIKKNNIAPEKKETQKNNKTTPHTEPPTPKKEVDTQNISSKQLPQKTLSNTPTPNNTSQPSDEEKISPKKQLPPQPKKQSQRKIQQPQKQSTELTKAPQPKKQSQRKIQRHFKEILQPLNSPIPLKYALRKANPQKIHFDYYDILYKKDFIVNDRILRGNHNIELLYDNRDFAKIPNLSQQALAEQLIIPNTFSSIKHFFLSKPPYSADLIFFNQLFHYRQSPFTHQFIRDLNNVSPFWMKHFSPELAKFRNIIHRLFPAKTSVKFHEGQIEIESLKSLIPGVSHIKYPYLTVPVQFILGELPAYLKRENALKCSIYTSQLPPNFLDYCQVVLFWGRPPSYYFNPIDYFQNLLEADIGFWARSQKDFPQILDFINMLTLKEQPSSPLYFHIYEKEREIFKLNVQVDRYRALIAQLEKGSILPNGLTKKQILDDLAKIKLQQKILYHEYKKLRHQLLKTGESIKTIQQHSPLISYHTIILKIPQRSKQLTCLIMLYPSPRLNLAKRIHFSYTQFSSQLPLIDIKYSLKKNNNICYSYEDERTPTYTKPLFNPSTFPSEEKLLRTLFKVHKMTSYLKREAFLRKIKFPRVRKYFQDEPSPTPQNEPSPTPQNEQFQEIEEETPPSSEHSFPQAEEQPSVQASQNPQMRRKKSIREAKELEELVEDMKRKEQEKLMKDKKTSQQAVPAQATIVSSQVSSSQQPAKSPREQESPSTSWPSLKNEEESTPTDLSSEQEKERRKNWTPEMKALEALVDEMKRKEREKNLTKEEKQKLRWQRFKEESIRKAKERDEARKREEEERKRRLKQEQREYEELTKNIWFQAGQRYTPETYQSTRKTYNLKTIANILPKVLEEIVEKVEENNSQLPKKSLEALQEEIKHSRKIAFDEDLKKLIHFLKPEHRLGYFIKDLGELLLRYGYERVYRNIQYLYFEHPEDFLSMLPLSVKDNWAEEWLIANNFKKKYWNNPYPKKNTKNKKKKKEN